jgi:hypothetical protein
MKYHLNVSIDGQSDSLVASYANKAEARRKWEQDALDFVLDNKCADDDWYPFVQRERANGETEEISFRELFEGVGGAA